jgi:hypothetical protein
VAYEEGMAIRRWREEERRGLCEFTDMRTTILAEVESWRIESPWRPMIGTDAWRKGRPRDASSVDTSRPLACAKEDTKREKSGYSPLPSWLKEYGPQGRQDTGGAMLT